MLRTDLTSTGSSCTLVLFTKVTNAAELRKLLLAGQLPKVCLLKAALVLDPFQVFVAANKAALAQQRNKLVTRSVFSEILFNLSPSKNITDSLQKFGIGDKDENLLAAFIDATEEEIKAVTDKVDGETTDVSQLSTLVDPKLIQKVQKLQNIDERQMTSLLISRPGVKDVVT